MTVLDMAIESFEDSLDNYEDHYGEDSFTQYAIEAFDDIMYALEAGDISSVSEQGEEKFKDLLDDANAETDEAAKQKKLKIAKRIALGVLAGSAIAGAGITVAKVNKAEGGIKFGNFKDYFATLKELKAIDKKHGVKKVLGSARHAGWDFNPDEVGIRDHGVYKLRKSASNLASADMSRHQHDRFNIKATQVARRNTNRGVGPVDKQSVLREVTGLSDGGEGQNLSTYIDRKNAKTHHNLNIKRGDNPNSVSAELRRMQNQFDNNWNSKQGK